MKKTMILSLVASAVLLAGCASSQPDYSKHVIVLNSVVEDNSGWKTGALVGAGLGVATGGGKSTSSKVGRAAVGASVGGSLQKGMTRGNIRNRSIVFDEEGQVSYLFYPIPLQPGQCMHLQKRGLKVSVLMAPQYKCDHIINNND